MVSGITVARISLPRLNMAFTRIAAHLPVLATIRALGDSSQELASPGVEEDQQFSSAPSL